MFEASFSGFGTGNAPAVNVDSAFSTSHAFGSTEDQKRAASGDTFGSFGGGAAAAAAGRDGGEGGGNDFQAFDAAGGWGSPSFQPNDQAQMEAAMEDLQLDESDRRSKRRDPSKRDKSKG